MKWMNVFFTTLADVLFQLLVILLLWVFVLQGQSQEHARIAASVPGLKTSLALARTDLDNALVGHRQDSLTIGKLRNEAAELSDSLDRARGEGALLAAGAAAQKTDLDSMSRSLRQLQGHYEGLQASASADAKAHEVILGRLKGELADAEKTISRQRGSMDSLAQAKDSLERENGVIKGKLKSGDPVTLVVLPDVTSSMKEALDMTRTSIATLFEVMPNTSRDFRVGILAFRRGVVKRFPITKILPAYEDGGASQRAVLSFLDSLKVENGMTDHLPVFEEAIRMLSLAHPEHDPARKERIILVSDVGVSEFDEQQGYSAAERQRKERILQTLRDWASDRDRAVEALYAENPWSIANDPARAENKAWFEDLGRISPHSAFYTESSAILRAVLHASLPRH